MHSKQSLSVQHSLSGAVRRGGGMWSQSSSRFDDEHDLNGLIGCIFWLGWDVMAWSRVIQSKNEKGER